MENIPSIIFPSSPLPDSEPATNASASKKIHVDLTIEQPFQRFEVDLTQSPPPKRKRKGYPLCERPTLAGPSNGGEEDNVFDLTQDSSSNNSGRSTVPWDPQQTMASLRQKELDMFNVAKQKVLHQVQRSQDTGYSHVRLAWTAILKLMEALEEDFVR